MAMNFAVEQRLRFIDCCLHHYGTFNRAALMDFFGISVVQASNDIKTYLSMSSPPSAVYDKSARTYKVEGDFVPLYPAFSERN